MSYLNSHLLTVVIFLPLAVAAVLAFVPSRYATEIRMGALAAAIGEIVLCALIFLVVNQSGEFDFVERCAWIPSLGIYYHVGVDGASAALMLFSAIVLAVSALSMFGGPKAQAKAIAALMLAAATGAMGAFASMDMYGFCIFVQAALCAAGVAVGISRSNGPGAAIRYAMFIGASMAALVAGVAYASQVAGSSDILAWYSASFSLEEQMWMFSLLAISFGILTPLIPFHSWLADAVGEAQMPAGIMLAGVALKLGCYGFFRIAIPSFPMAAAFFMDAILVLSAVGIIGGALLMIAEDDLKKFVAYSMIPQGGIVMLGLASMNAAAAAGSIIQMANFGLTSAALLFMVGLVMERSNAAGGAVSARRIPLIAAALVIIALSFIGMPGLNNFSGEFLVFMGSFQTQTLFSALGMAGFFFMIAGMMWAVGRTIFRDGAPGDHVRDMGPREFSTALLMVVSIVLFGLFPNVILTRVWHPAKAFVTLSKRVAVEESVTSRAFTDGMDGRPDAVYKGME